MTNITKNLLKELSANLPFMKGVEKLIAESILANPHSFINYSLVKASEDIGVSQGSIINFANKYVGDGFPTLKMQIAVALAQPNEQNLSTANTDSVRDVLSKTTQNLLISLRNTETLNSEENLLKLVDLILNAKRIEVYGEYRSAVVASDFCFQLAELGIPTSTASDHYLCIINANIMTRDTLFIVVSYSGSAPSLIDATKIAKEKGVPIVLLTATKNSALAEIADLTILFSHSGNSMSANGTEVRVSQLIFIEALCAYLRKIINKNDYTPLSDGANN